MAPEVLAEDLYSCKADIWSLGVVYYQMLFGQAPFKGNNNEEMLADIIKKKLYYPNNAKIT